MTTDRIITIISLSITVLAVVISVWAARHWGNPHLRMLVECEATPLIPILRGAGSQRLKLTFDGAELQNPYVVSVRLTNVGAGDIASDRYDQGKSIQVKSKARFYSLLQGDAKIPQVGDETIIEFPPNLQKRGEIREAVFIVSRPTGGDLGGSGGHGQKTESFIPEIDLPLVNVDVTDEATTAFVQRTLLQILKVTAEQLLPIRFK